MIDVGDETKDVLKKITALPPLTKDTVIDWAKVIKDYLLLFEKVPATGRVADIYEVARYYYYTVMDGSEKTRKRFAEEEQKRIEDSYELARKEIETDIGFPNSVSKGFYPDVSNLDELIEHSDFKRHELDLAVEVAQLQGHQRERDEELEAVDRVAKHRGLTRFIRMTLFNKF